MAFDDDSSISAKRVSSDLPVPFSDALDEWAVVARDVLIEIAGVYGMFITQAELALRVQNDSGVRAGQPVRLWIDDLLLAVTRDQKDDEPLLASLCVRLDQSVGDVYSKIVESAGRTRLDDVEVDAAHQRFACYQRYGATVPAGARPSLTPRVSEKRAAHKPAKQTKPKAAPKPRTASASKSVADGSASTPKAAKPRKAAKPKPEPKEEPKPKLCPTCFTVLPATGVCGYCG
ncbi:hypothetical protein [Gordonia phthalatica]|uniref:hypothetical protein n=1 Tax=Gordonia phthalatica TaxID=1136941 RepID=UPI000780F10D|nr:hypothetical protein [Gordonia phthalatica]